MAQLEREIRIEPDENEDVIFLHGSSKRDHCPLCKSELAFGEDNFLACTNSECGYLMTNIVDHTAEWRYFGAEDSNTVDPTRCGLPINDLLPESSFGCKIVSRGRVSYKMHKTIRYSEWQFNSYREKAQYESFQHIIQMAQKAEIKRVIIDDALKIHKKISDFDMSFRGENRDGLLAASIYISCRMNKFPRSTKEIAQIFALDVRSATKGCKNAQMIINRMEEGLTAPEKTQFAVTTPQAFIERYCSKLNLDSYLTKLALFMAMKMEQQTIMPENTPQSIAAGIVYYIASLGQLPISKKDVRSVSEISEVTINKCYRKIDTHRHLLVPPSELMKFGRM